MRIRESDNRAGSSRGGYAMLLVVVSIALILSLYSVSYRLMAGVLRTEESRVRQEDRDTGRLVAAARGLQLLETGLPPADPYVCATIVTGPSGDRSFTVSFTSTGANRFSVTASPTAPSDSPPPMPASFAAGP